MPRGDSANQGSVRRHNLALVLRALHRDGPLCRAELAAVLRMPKVTISNLVADLVSRGLIGEASTERTGTVGRPKTPLHPTGHRVAGLGLEIDPFRLGVCLVDASGTIRFQQHVDRDSRKGDARAALGELAKLARQGLRFASEADIRICGTTVAVPGLVESRSGVVRVAPHLKWTDVPARTWLRQALDPRSVPVVSIENEANTAACFEIFQNPQAADRGFVYVSLGTGVGAGVVLGGQLFRGSHGFGGELGHMTLDPAGPRCCCGNRGCLEAYIGSEALLRQARSQLSTSLRGRNPTEKLADLAARSTKGARAIVRAAGERLAVALSSYANLFDPAEIVLGGESLDLARQYLPIVAAQLKLRVLGSRWATTSLRESRLAAHGSLIGAAFDAMGRVRDDPTLAPRSRPVALGPS